jgi:hypothetical protein
MSDTNSKSWQLNRQIGLSTIVQLGLLAALIIGSWMNLQRQLDLLQRDVTMLLECQKRFEQKVEELSATNVSHEYRICTLEVLLSKSHSNELSH